MYWGLRRSSRQLAYSDQPQRCRYFRHFTPRWNLCPDWSRACSDCYPHQLSFANHRDHKSNSQMPRAVVYGAGRFVVVGDNIALSSTNGHDWESHSVTGDFGSLTFASDRFVAVGSRVSIASTNGTDWTAGAVPVSFGYGEGKFVCVSINSDVMTSVDGRSYHARQAQPHQTWPDCLG